MKKVLVVLSLVLSTMSFANAASLQCAVTDEEGMEVLRAESRELKNVDSVNLKVGNYKGVNFEAGNLGTQLVLSAIVGQVVVVTYARNDAPLTADLKVLKNKSNPSSALTLSCVIK